MHKRRRSEPATTQSGSLFAPPLTSSMTAEPLCNTNNKKGPTAFLLCRLSRIRCAVRKGGTGSRRVGRTWNSYTPGARSRTRRKSVSVWASEIRRLGFQAQVNAQPDWRRNIGMPYTCNKKEYYSNKRLPEATRSTKEFCRSKQKQVGNRKEVMKVLEERCSTGISQVKSEEKSKGRHIDIHIYMKDPSFMKGNRKN